MCYSRLAPDQEGPASESAPRHGTKPIGTTDGLGCLPREMTMSSPGSTDLKVPMFHALVRVPAGVRLERTQMVGLALYHALALLAFLPWFFSWTGVLLAVLGIYVFGVLGINIGYHRLLTHKGFVCPKWLERSFALLGVCCLQGSPSRWVATHRRHHEHADDEPRPA